jgi:hypothetical protein
MFTAEPHNLSEVSLLRYVPVARRLFLIDSPSSGRARKQFTHIAHIYTYIMPVNSQNQVPHSALKRRYLNVVKEMSERKSSRL